MRNYKVPDGFGGSITVQLDEDVAAEIEGAEPVEDPSSKQAKPPANKARAASTVKNK